MRPEGFISKMGLIDPFSGFAMVELAQTVVI